MRQQILAGLRKAHPAGMTRVFEVVTWIKETPLPEPKDRTRLSE
jgi:hypothetical protein